MKPLPTAAYEPAVWPPDLTVGPDYLVSDGMNKYSVPFDLIGEKVNLRLTKNAVEVFYRGTRVAMHARHRTVLRDPVVKPEHMTPEHRKYLNYNESEFTSWGSSVGEHTASKALNFFDIRNIGIEKIICPGKIRHKFWEPKSYKRIQFVRCAR